MPEVMLAKCAETQALRRAFPAELSGIAASHETGDAPLSTAAPQPMRSTPQRAPVPTLGQMSAPKKGDGLMEKFALRIQGCWSQDDLQQVGEAISAALEEKRLTDVELVELKKLYREASVPLKERETEGGKNP